MLRLSTALWRRPWARATLLLTPPLAWFLLVYIASLVVLLVTAFWSVNPFTTNIDKIWTLSNFQQRESSGFSDRKSSTSGGRSGSSAIARR